MKEKDPVSTFEFSPSTIGFKRFNIPIYQRLYAWEEVQVVKLLDDMHTAYNKNPESFYYIGNLTLSEKNGVYDLIDGQQRITTLWLMGFIFRGKVRDWGKFLLLDDGSLRISFHAREADEIYLRSLLVIKDQIANFDDNDVNHKMAATIKFTREFLMSKFLGNKNEEKNFIEYVYNKVKIVAVLLPEVMDLNKYFELMNNRGAQLEQHEILKARILNNISEEDRKKYSSLWGRCSQMNSYFDKNRDSQDGSSDTGDGWTIEKIVNDHKIMGKESHGEEKEEKVTSIVGFSEFILHVYKIWKRSVSMRIEDKKLLEIASFNNVGSDESKSFLDFLVTTQSIDIVFHAS